MLNVHALKKLNIFFPLALGAAGNFLCPASQLSYNGLKTGTVMIKALGSL